MKTLHLSLRFLTVLLLILWTGGCDLFTAEEEQDEISVNDPIERRDLPRALSSEEEQIVDGFGDFGFEMMHKLIRSNSDDNHFISPLSILMAYGMVLNGAEGNTLSQMQKVLGMENLSQQEINRGARDLINLLTTFDEKVRFNVANSIWYRDSFEVEEDFLNTNRDAYDAMIDSTDFNDPQTVERINQWVSDHTKSLIDEIVEGPIDPLTVMYLINAVYFNGEWTIQFDPEDTTQEPFHRPDGTAVETNMMHLEEAEDILYLNGESPAGGYQAVNLYYGDAGFAMTLVLPDENTSLQSWISETGWEDWQGLTEQFQPATVSLAMPKFELEYEVDDFKQILKEMGIVDAFDPALSDFSKINPSYEDLHISDTRHKTFIRVDEEGTEAAAVTSIETRIVSTPRFVNIRFDRPFLFIIREVESGTILFMGSMTDPIS